MWMLARCWTGASQSIFTPSKYRLRDWVGAGADRAGEGAAGQFDVTEAKHARELGVCEVSVSFLDRRSFPSGSALV